MIKVAVIGPESTGKTGLSKNLAEYYKAYWVPEYAREYIGRLDRDYVFSDIVAIAEKQVEEELFFDDKGGETGYVFYDTELIITKVWFEYKYQEAPAFVNDRLQKGFFDLYLLCYYDLPWQPDPLREHGDDRDYFYERYKCEIERLGKPYVIITGEGEERFQNAVYAVENFTRNFIKTKNNGYR